MLAALAREGVENTSLAFLPLFFHDQRTHCAAREPRALSQCVFGVVFRRYFKNSSEMLARRAAWGFGRTHVLFCLHSWLSMFP